MIHYLVDSSASWRILREPAIRAGWADIIADHGIGSGQPQRAEFRRPARNAAGYDLMSTMFAELYPALPFRKAPGRRSRHIIIAWFWRALTVHCPVWTFFSALWPRKGELVIRHDGSDFATAGRHLTDVRERHVRQWP